MGRAACLLAALAVGLAFGLAACAPLGDFAQGTAVPFGGPTDGKDPHFASGGLLEGSCGYGELDPKAWPHWVTVAISPAHALFANASRTPAAGCGACLEIFCDARPGFEGRCPPNSDTSPGVIALVTDTCKDCGANKLTLHYLAFQQRLASPEGGEVGIRYRPVECPAPGGIVAEIDTYRATEGGYLRLSLENVAGSGALSSIELRRSPLGGDRLSLAGTSWTRMKNSWGSKWELSGLPEGPLDMRITSDGGQELVARQAIAQAGATGKVQLGVQFGTAGGPPLGSSTHLSGAALRQELQEASLLPPASSEPTPPAPPPATGMPQPAAAAAAAAAVPPTVAAASASVAPAPLANEPAATAPASSTVPLLAP